MVWMQMLAFMPLVTAMLVFAGLSDGSSALSSGVALRCGSVLGGGAVRRGRAETQGLASHAPARWRTAVSVPG